MEYFAICMQCKNSIFLKVRPTGSYCCPVCGQAFGNDLQTAQCLLVQQELAATAYNDGQEYFNNTDYGEANKYFRRVLEYNPNHYLAVYFSHICTMYEEDYNPNFDLVDKVATAMMESVNSVVLSRVDLPKRLGFLTLIFNDCYTLVSNHYKKLTTEFSDVDKSTHTQFRANSFKFALSIKKITALSKDAIMAYNSNMTKHCIAFADIGIMACHNVVQPYIVKNRTSDELSLPSDNQYYRMKLLCRDFVSYAQSLNASFVQTVGPNYGNVLTYIYKHVVSLRNKYYEVNKDFTHRYLSYKPDLFKKLSSISSFAVKYAHHMCFSSLFVDKNKNYELLIYESVDNCFDALMPRIQQVNKGKNVDIWCMEFKEYLMIAEHLNDFLKELYKIDREYAIKKVYFYFRYVYEGVHKFYVKIKRNYFRVSSKLNDEEYKLSLGRYLTFLYQVASVCVLTALVNDIDKNVVGNTREDMLQLALDACMAFDSMSDINATDITELAKFGDFEELFDIVKHSCGLDRGISQSKDKFDIYNAKYVV